MKNNTVFSLRSGCAIIFTEEKRSFFEACPLRALESKALQGFVEKRMVVYILRRRNDEATEGENMLYFTVVLRRTVGRL